MEEVTPQRRACPDDGTCHHGCESSCWRVSTCLPLTASGWDDWPADVKAANPPDGRARIEDALIGSAAFAHQVEP